MTGDLLTIPREEFISRRFRYRRGEHITIVGPTGCGKTWLAWQILDRITSPTMPGVVLVKKPADPITTARARAAQYRQTRVWPPPWTPWKPSRPAGWVVWPITRFDPDIDRPHKFSVFGRTLMDVYGQKRKYFSRTRGRVVYVDDAYGVSEILDLREYLIEMWTELRSTNGGLMTAFQKPSHVPLWAFNQASHLFLFQDADKRNRERFAEISGVDSDMVKDTVKGLRKHQALYIRQDGPRMCVVDI